MANYRVLICTGSLLVLVALLQTSLGWEAEKSTESTTVAAKPRLLWWCSRGDGWECFKFASQRNQICDARGCQRRWLQLNFLLPCHCCGVEESPTTTTTITTPIPPSPPTTTDTNTTETTLPTPTTP